MTALDLVQKIQTICNERNLLLEEIEVRLSWEYLDCGNECIADAGIASTSIDENNVLTLQSNW